MPLCLLRNPPRPLWRVARVSGRSPESRILVEGTVRDCGACRRAVDRPPAAVGAGPALDVVPRTAVPAQLLAPRPVAGTSLRLAGSRRPWWSPHRDRVRPPSAVFPRLSARTLWPPAACRGPPRAGVSDSTSALFRVGFGAHRLRLTLLGDRARRPWPAHASPRPGSGSLPLALAAKDDCHRDDRQYDDDADDDPYELTRIHDDPPFLSNLSSR